ncbi:flagellar hook-length control protein FliK [Brenneria tiliae]|uniref:flagellar hook-length control protein FliK n=1 Tax=Brenneria tiliae TaxID=2914984 RepID=UPI002014C5FA|nr:flagellar hook-length control protein FliK [Brenneria tiliae]MCL2899834.1 flagellar hook-length control protein FliK [Brenneria tiliae]MCL2904677.1 flagellar hook-length control protein FliK [Brenneria tiliae]
MNLSSVSNVAANNSASADLSSTRQSESGSSFEQMLSAHREASPSTATTSADNSTTSNANKQQATESVSAQSRSKEPQADKTASRQDDVNNDDKPGIAETENASADADLIPVPSALKNASMAMSDKGKKVSGEDDVQLALNEPSESVVDSALLPTTQETTGHQDENDLSSDTPDAATLSLLSMLNQVQTTKTNAPSVASTTVVNDTLTPAQSAAVSLTLTGEVATTDTTTESDKPLTPFITAGADADNSQLNRADTAISKKTGFSTDANDNTAGNTALSAATARSSESISANTAGNTSPLIPPPSQILSATAPAASTVATSTAMLNAQMGSEAWHQTLGQQIILFARDGQQNARLRLHPEELGSLQISLTLNNDNEAQLHFVSAHSQVRAALEAALPHLRTSLAESGIDLGQASVGSESSQSWAQDQQTSDSGFVQQSDGTSSEGLATPLNVPASLQQMASGVTGVDIFA